MRFASKSTPGREYEVHEGRCSCPAYTYRKRCRHVDVAADIDARERAIMERAPSMTTEAELPIEGPIFFAHKTVHEALAAIYREVGYVQKKGRVESFGAKYRYAGEADLISAIRPSMVEHEVYMHTAQVLNRTGTSFTNAKGTVMQHVTLDLVVRFTHGPSGTSVDCMAAGEGIDSGDKATPKALTGAYKYALRQMFCIETGDDPDTQASFEQERHERPVTNGTPLPEFPAARGNAGEEWQVLTQAVIEKRVTRPDVIKLIGEFSQGGLARYLANHPGTSAATVVTTIEQAVGAR